MTERLQGRVIGSGRLPIAGASVVIASGSPPSPDIAAETDERGEFTLSGLTAGIYLLRAYAPDGARGEAWARLPPSSQQIEIKVGSDELSTSEEDGDAPDDGDEDQSNSDLAPYQPRPKR